MSRALPLNSGLPEEGGARRPRRAAGLASLALLLLAGCSGGKEAYADTSAGAAAAPDATNVVAEAKTTRREFVVMREIVRQHALQQGNDKRLAAVEKALREKFPELPDKGATDEEQEIYRAAAGLMESLR